MTTSLQLPLLDIATAPSPKQRNDHLTFRANRLRGRHGWLRLTPAYSVNLVEELVAGCMSHDLVLDPFCGTGTTALVCAEAQVDCHTVDINPFLVWLTEAKCANYSATHLFAAEKVLAEALATMGQSRGSNWVPPIKDIDKWWLPETLQLISHVFAWFNEPTMPPPTRNLLMVIFCGAVIELAAVSFGHQSMSFRKHGNSSAAPVDTALEVRIVFRRVAESILASANDDVPANKVTALLGDARQLNSVLPTDGYSKVITSPPYPNRMSYIRELRPYMYWLGYLNDGRQAGELDWQAIGGTWGCATSKLMQWQPDNCISVPYDNFPNIIAGVSERSSILARYVDKYFRDIVQHVTSLKQVLAPTAQVSYVVGNSKFYNVLLPTQDIYAAIFAAQGFGDVLVTPIRKRTSKKELFEYIVSAKVT